MTRMKNALLAATVAVTGLSAATAAHAAAYLVTYNVGASAFTGTVTTTNTSNTDGFFTITGLTGTRDGQAVSLLPTGSIGGNDNLFKPTPDYINAAGFSYSVGSLGYNPFLGIPGVYFECQGTTTACGPNPTITNFTVTAITAAVPETATWGMMIAGFGMMGAALRTRRRSTTVTFA